MISLSGLVDGSLQVASAKTLEHGQVCMASENLYHQCSKRSNISRPTYTHTLDQMGVIHDYLSDLSFMAKARHLPPAGLSELPTV